MPSLEVMFHSFQTNLQAGQVCEAFLEVNNKGTSGLRDLIVKSSHPSVFQFGDPSKPHGVEYVPKSGTDESYIKEELVVENSITDVGLYNIPLPVDSTEASGVLGAQMTTLVPVWVRAGKPGKYNFKFLFLYQSVHGEGGAYRLLRYTVNCTIYSNFRMNVFTRPSLTRLDEFIIGIELENVNPQKEFKVRQLSCISPSWSIIPISGL
jgi:hypothetical protein